jgi:Zn-dependent M32 family carboxypeptidase
VGRTAGALARSTAIHESQSLFFEMQLGRSEAFLKHLLPAVHARFGSQAAFSEENFIAWNQREAGLYPRRCGRSELPGTWCCAMRLSAR